jgi:CRISPR/Cas system-associated exonuclease Cas4 (RecB family)
MIAICRADKIVHVEKMEKLVEAYVRLVLTLMDQLVRSVKQEILRKMLRPNFKHENIDLGYEDLKAETLKSGRTYITPTGEKYPSITTALGYRDRGKWAKWRANIGEEEAKRITRHATTRGTAVHNIAERYINNEEDYIRTPGDRMPHVLHSWTTLRKVINDKVGKVYMQECPLYSSVLKVAGRVDCIAEFDGELSIVDFKTSGRIKERSEISSYFMQECAYALMFEERTGIAVNQLVTLMVVDGDDKPIIFKENTEDWVDPLIEELTYYYENR